MIFSLEALSARHGDCLILHYGDVDSPRLIIIDGGPAGVYGESLRPRLEQYRASRTPDEELPVELLMVSHIDDDHIRGVLDLAEELSDRTESQQPLPYRIRRFWFNAFDEIIGNQEAGVSSGSSSATAVGHLQDPASAAVVASVNQGRKLRDLAKKLAISLNSPFAGLVMANAPEGSEVDMGDGLRLNVIAPNQARVEALQKEWDAELKVALDREEAAARAASYLDRSIPNLSSIVVIARSGDRSMLLTGDARGDHILESLASAGVLVEGKLHVDVFKLPHHGSVRNVEPALFETIRANHYVVSADGRDGNPEVETLQMLTASRIDDQFMIHVTNSIPHVDDFFAQERAAGRQYEFVVRPQGSPSVMVNLMGRLKESK